LDSEDQMIPGRNDTSEDKVVVQPEIKSDASVIQGGLLMEGRGKVISIGGAVKTVKPGDEVTFNEAEGQEVLLFGKVLKILSERDVNPVTEKDS